MKRLTVPAEDRDLRWPLLAATRRSSNQRSNITTPPSQRRRCRRPHCGAVATLASTAAVAGTFDVVIEAESMTVSPTSAGKIFKDSSASGRKALRLSANATATQTVSLPASTRLVIRARGDQYKGAPMHDASPSMDNVVSTTQVSSTSWTDYSIPIDVPAGTHTISIAFTNDYRKRRPPARHDHRSLHGQLADLRHQPLTIFQSGRLAVEADRFEPGTGRQQRDMGELSLGAQRASGSGPLRLRGDPDPSVGDHE